MADRSRIKQGFIAATEREAVRVVAIESAGDAQAVQVEVITKVEPRLRAAGVLR